MRFDIANGSDTAGPETTRERGAVGASTATGSPRTRRMRRAIVVGPATLCVLAAASAPAVSAHAAVSEPAGAGASARISVSAVAAVDRAPRAAARLSVKARVQLARTSLATSVTRLSHRKFHLAIASLDALAGRIAKASRAARNEIGKPPTDPESDQLPGPPAVLAVMGLEHSVQKTLVPEFDDRKRPGVIEALRVALFAAQVRRDNLLDAVLALKPGARGDYSDGMADTLPVYPQEIRQLTSALATFTLRPASRTILTTGQTRIHATRVKIDRAFGGGE
jgi:hypothetical protein